MLPVNHPIIQYNFKEISSREENREKAALSILISYTKKTNTNKREKVFVIHSLSVIVCLNVLYRLKKGLATSKKRRHPQATGTNYEIVVAHS